MKLPNLNSSLLTFIFAEIYNPDIIIRLELCNSKMRLKTIKYIQKISLDKEHHLALLDRYTPRKLIVHAICIPDITSIRDPAETRNSIPVAKNNIIENKYQNIIEKLKSLIYHADIIPSFILKFSYLEKLNIRCKECPRYLNMLTNLKKLTISSENESPLLPASLLELHLQGGSVNVKKCINLKRIFMACSTEIKKINKLKNITMIEICHIEDHLELLNLKFVPLINVKYYPMTTVIRPHQHGTYLCCDRNSVQEVDFNMIKSIIPDKGWDIESSNDDTMALILTPSLNKEI